MRITVVVFPGSNCDHDVMHGYEAIFGQTVTSVWHKEHDLQRPDVVVVPGGFSFGDYLRTGALAKLSPIMQEVAAFAKSGGPVLGICNGFQILCEAGLLPGVLLQNIDMRFISRFVHLRIENTTSRFSSQFRDGEVICCPIAHMEGNYFADTETLARLEGEGQIVVRYCDSDGAVRHDDRRCNPNGSRNSIAGISNSAGNVVGMMPHPERVLEASVGAIGAESGRGFLASGLSAAGSKFF